MGMTLVLYTIGTRYIKGRVVRHTERRRSMQCAYDIKRPMLNSARAAEDGYAGGYAPGYVGWYVLVQAPSVGKVSRVSVSVLLPVPPISKVKVYSLLQLANLRL